MRGKPFTFDDFSKGLNLRDAPYLVDSGFGRDGRNVVGTERGALRKRHGSTAFCSPAAEVLGLFACGSVAKLIASTSVGTLLGIAGDGATTTLATTPTPAEDWCWVEAPTSGGQGPFYGTSLGLSNMPQSWDGVAGSTAAWTFSGGSTPVHRALYLTYAGTRVWMAHISGDGSAIRWSEIGDPRTYPAANITRFDPEDGDFLSGIGTVGSYVLVFKPTKTWAVHDLDTSANRPLSRSIGCVSHRSIAETPKGTMWLSREGVYRTNGQGIEKLSDAIDPLLSGLPAGALRKAAACYFDEHYYLAVSTAGGRNDLLLDYDVAQGAWWIHTLAVAQPVVWEPSSGPELYAAKASATPRVLKLFVPGVMMDEGVPFDTYWKSAWHVFKTPYLRKRMRQAHFDGTGRILFRVAKGFTRSDELSRDIDFAQADGFWGVNDGTDWGDNDGGLWGGTLELGEAEAYSQGVSRAWSVVVGNASDDDFRIDQYTLSMTTRKD